MLIEYRVRIRNAANSADALVVTSVSGGTNPYIENPPTGDGETIDPRTGDTTLATYTYTIVNGDIGSMQRLVTSQLEDSDGRQQLGYRVAIGEFRIDGGAWLTQINGLVTRIRQDTSAKYLLTISDPLHQLLAVKLFAPSSDTLITDFLSEWPARGCILGGPIIGGSVDAMRIKDLGGWLMRVQASGRDLGAQEYGLQPMVVYGPPTWEATDKMRVVDLQDAINEAVSQLQMPLSNGAASPWDSIGDALTNGWAWRGVTVLIDDVPWKPLTVYDEGTAVAQVQRALLVTGSARGHYAMKVKSDGTRTLTDGQIVRVRVLSVLPTEVSPLYITGHPVEVLRRFFTAGGVAFSTSAADALEELLGTDASLTLRITGAAQLAGLASTVNRAFGIGMRGNDDGEIEVFDARLGRATTDPLDTITADDVVDGSVHAFELDPSEAIRDIVFQTKFFADQRSVPIRRSDQSIVDGVAVVDQSLPLSDTDPGALPQGTFTISIDAMIAASRSLYPSLVDFLAAIARRLFDRWGRGGVGAEMTLLRGGVGDSLQVGDEILVDLPQVPNHNYLLGDNPLIAARAMQIVRRSVRPIGYDVKLVDSGATRQPPATIPTVSIAASSDLPRTVAEATIGNAATLNGAGYGARLQVAFTDDGSDADATQFTDVMAWGPSDIPTGAVRLPPVIAGTTVQVRARSELPGARGTNWSASDKATLSGVDAPSGLSATPDADGSKCLLAWTPGSATDLADIWLRLDGQTFAQATRVRTLEAGSIQFLLQDLEPGTDYIATVQHRDPATHDVSDPVDVSFTSGGTGVTLTAPADPCPFASSIIPGRVADRLFGSDRGIYGIGVVATDIPGELEVEEAIETGVGAGTWGTADTVDRIAAVSGNWSLYQRIAPHDGLRRRLRMRAVRDGATPSSWSDWVIATPWLYQPLAAYPGDALLELKVSPLTPTAPDRFAFRLTARDPFPRGTSDLTLDLSAETGLVIYEYNTTTPASFVAVASGSDNDYEAIRPDAGDGAKSVSWTLEKTGRRTGLSGPIVVPEQPYVATGAPTIDFVGTSAAFTPCDGGGNFTLSVLTSNIPGGAVFDVVWTVAVGTYAGATHGASGVANGDIIGDGGVGGFSVPLCAGDTLRITITYVVDGVTLAATSNEVTV